MRRQELIIFAIVLLMVIAVFGCKLKTERTVETDNRLPAIVKLYQIPGGGFCTGTVISSALILTAAHCVDVKSPVFAVRDINNVLRTVATATRVERAGDWALLTGTFSAFKAMPIETDTRAIIRGFEQHRVRMCGFPYTGELYCNDFTYHAPFLFSMAGRGHLFPGMSGGPVIDMQTGKIIGVNNGVYINEVMLAPLVSLFAQGA